MNGETSDAQGEGNLCATCRRPLTKVGANGECLRCLAGLLFGGDDEEPAPSNPRSPQRSTPGPLRYAHFEIEVGEDGFPIELGAGAMGVMYRARDTVLNSPVALKVIGCTMAANPAARTRFLREARAAARLHHPNVARVTHYGEQEGECFYVMELVEGETLEERVRREGPLPLATALEVIEQAARALAAAEAHGIVHRDIKPSNVMIESEASGSMLVKVIDYGVAKMTALSTEAGIDQTQGGFVGTPAFASPEQFAGASVTVIDTRSDIYSLGVTLWYLLTGRTPFVGRTIDEVRQRQSADLPLAQLRDAHVPGPVVALLKSMLAADPANRPANARELLDTVRACRLRFDPAARARRRRSVFAGAAAALVIAMLAVAALVFQHSRSSAALDRSIAVLPFDNLSSDPDNAFFTDGVQDQILTDLAKIGELKVISRTSVMQYRGARNLREIGSQLGVAHVLEGSVQRAGSKVRVTAQLIDARTDAHLWAQTYDRDLADVFAIQSEIAKTIADQLQAKLSPNEKNAIEQPLTTDVGAFELYSRANSLLLAAGLSATGEADRRQAIELLDDAVKRDRVFFDAYTRLAFAHLSLYSVAGVDHTPARLALAEAALQTAERLRPDSAETHLARGQFLYYGKRDYAGALAELEIAEKSLPNDPRTYELTGYILRRRGEQEEGLRNLQRALELDPRNAYLLQQITASYNFLGRYADAVGALDRLLTITPDRVETRIQRALFEFFWKGDTQPLRRTVDDILTQRPEDIGKVADAWFVCALAERNAPAAERALLALGDNPAWSESTINLSRSFGEGLLARMTNDDTRARAAFEAAREQQAKSVAAQPNYGPALCVLAMIDAALGNSDAALRQGRRAMTLTPIEKDSVNGSFVVRYFAITAALAGDKELALQQLDVGMRAPVKSLAYSYGAMKLLPFWDSLRGDPRFEEIVASRAPRPTDR